MVLVLAVPNFNFVIFKNIAFYNVILPLFL